MLRFLLGVLFGALVLCPAAVYLYVRSGQVSLATTASPVPGEAYLAHVALRASVGNARERKNPLPMSDADFLAAAKTYRENCALCHGLPGQAMSEIVAGMFPPPPQLLEGKEMVTDDPEGSIFWKISNGIRLSGMPRFDSMPETVRWQLTMLLKNADKLPPAAANHLRQALDGPR